MARRDPTTRRWSGWDNKKVTDQVIREFRRAVLRAPGVAAAYGYFTDGDTPRVHRGLPSRHLAWVISLEDPIETGQTPESWEQGTTASHEVIVAGLRTNATYVAQPRRQVGIQLAIHPLAARRLFGVRAGELTALSYDGEDVLGQRVPRLRERLRELRTWPARFAEIERFLAAGSELTTSGETPRREVAVAWRYLAERGGSATVTELGRHTAMSSRQLGKLFERELGMGPKTVASLMRFDHVVAAIAAAVRAGRAPRMAEIAARCGFYDQSHLVREFRRFTDTTPGRFLAEEFGNIQAGGHQPPTH